MERLKRSRPDWWQVGTCRIVTHTPTVAAQQQQHRAVAALAAHVGKSVGTVDFPSAFLNCDIPEGSEKVCMKLVSLRDKFSM